MFYSYDDKCFEYEVKYSNRKSIEIRIEPGGKVVFKAPKKTPDHIILEVIEKPKIADFGPFSPYKNDKKIKKN